jgi:hypothetical protein
MIDDPDNYLRMNREISVELDEVSSVDLELAPGEMSVHGGIVHSSRRNHSARRRMGYAAMYLPPQVKMGVSSLTSASLVRGEDRYGHYVLEPEPACDFAPPPPSPSTRRRSARTSPAPTAGFDTPRAAIRPRPQPSP